MLGVSKILVLDDSLVFRETMRRILRAHSELTLAASSLEEGIRTVEASPDLDLILCDVVLPDGDGFKLLEHVASLPKPRPQVVFVTASPNEEGEERARRSGAIGYLGKPVRFHDLSVVWKQHLDPSWNHNPRVRCPLLGRAHVIDRHGAPRSLVSWVVQDLSMTGAFLTTNGPVSPGTELDLELEFGEHRARIAVVVVRVQEPSWSRPGGVGVRFLELDAEARTTLEATHARWGVELP